VPPGKTMKALLPALIGTLLLVACEGGSVAGGERICRPGETEPCTCADGREGVWP
jgi:hypothetical protein